MSYFVFLDIFLQCTVANEIKILILILILLIIGGLLDPDLHGQMQIGIRIQEVKKC